MTATGVMARPAIEAEAAMVDGLDKLEQWVASIETGREALDAHESIKQVREWLKIRKAATEHCVRAARIEATALRRIGQLGCPEEMSRAWKGYANGFASLSEAEFESLLDEASDKTTAPSIWRIYVTARDAGIARARGDDAGRGIVTARLEDAGVSHRSFAAGVRTVLSAMSEHGDTFTVGEMSDELVRWCADEYPEGQHPFIDDPDFRQGMSEVVRYALRNEPGYDLAGLDLPSFVTFETSGGWVRVPLVNATLGQLRQMVWYREKQAKAMAFRATNLKVALADLERRAPANDDETTVASIIPFVSGYMRAEVIEATS